MSGKTDCKRSSLHLKRPQPRPGMKVLYTSGYTDNSIVHHGRLDQGVLLLTKPYRKNQLAEMVRQALKGGR